MFLFINLVPTNLVTVLQGDSEEVQELTKSCSDKCSCQDHAEYYPLGIMLRVLLRNQINAEFRLVPNCLTEQGLILF